MSPRPPIARRRAWIAAALAAWCAAACHPTREIARDETPIVDRQGPEGPELDDELGPLVPIGPARMPIPRGWVSIPGKERAWRSGPSQPRATLNVIVGAPGAQGASAQEIWAALSRAYQAEADAVQRFVEDGAVDLGQGRQAWRFLISRQEQGARYTLLQLVVVGRAHIYYVTFTARAEDFEAAEAGFWRAARTFDGDL